MTEENTNNPYAVIDFSGKQFKVSEGSLITVESEVAGDIGAEISVDRVLLARDGSGKVSVGAPTVAGASVTLKKVGEDRASKVIVFKKKRRQGYKKKAGHRQGLTNFEVASVSFG